MRINLSHKVELYRILTKTRIRIVNSSEIIAGKSFCCIVSLRYGIRVSWFCLDMMISELCPYYAITVVEVCMPCSLCRLVLYVCIGWLE